MSEIALPLPLSNQAPILADRARFKTVRAGRRYGKSRLALRAALVGHGEGRWKGMLDGLDIAWLTPDYPQSRAIWREEIRPRFSGVDGITLSEASGKCLEKLMDTSGWCR